MVSQSGSDSLTQMSIDGQLGKLGALYAEKSDGELLDLHDKRDGLTELAQLALAAVMRERGLGGRGDTEYDRGGDSASHVGLA